MIELFSALIVGCMIGIAAMAGAASRAYEKGRKDGYRQGIESLPDDISNYLNDQI